jgi:hypothetical protein
VSNKESYLNVTSFTLEVEEKKKLEENFYRNSLITKFASPARPGYYLSQGIIKETLNHNTQSVQMQTSFRIEKSKHVSININDKTLILQSGLKSNIRKWKEVKEKGKKFDSGNFTLPLFSEIIKH